MGKRRPKLSRDEYLKLAWTRGLLTYKLFDYQDELYLLISEGRSLKTVINISRRYGKTTTLLLYALIFAIQRPNSLIRFASPTQKSLRKIIHPIMRMLIEDAPRELRPRWSSVDSCYRLPNGSEIHLAGVNNGHEDDLRGQRCDLGIVDEAGDVTNLKYLYQSILLPQCLTCGGRIIIASTPPAVEDHDFKTMCQEAKYDGAYIERTIYDNKNITPEIIEEYAKESGGKDSVTFRREYMCKFETEKERSIVPEFNDILHVQDIPRDNYFDYYHRYVFMDLGVKRHYTSVLFGYYDFLKATLIIEDEFRMRGSITTEDIVAEIKGKERSLWGTLRVNQRIADSNNPLLINDLSYLHGLPVVATNKDTLEAMVNEMRMFIGAGRLIVHPRCEYLIDCLRYGVWKDKKIRQEFAESKVYGHYDALAAIMYGIRNIDKHTNPIPHLHNVNPANTWINPQEYQRVNKNLSELSKMFGTTFRN